jgi:hypothetical protein
MLLEFEVAKKASEYAEDILKAGDDWLREHSGEYSQVIEKMEKEGIDIVLAFESDKTALVNSILEEIDAMHEAVA